VGIKNCALCSSVVPAVHQLAYRPNVQHVIDLTRGFGSFNDWIRYGISIGRCGSTASMQPSAMAPSARIALSRWSQSLFQSLFLRGSSITFRRSVENRTASTSSAAAAHFRRFHSVDISSAKSSSSISSSKSSSSPSSCSSPYAPTFFGASEDAGASSSRSNP